MKFERVLIYLPYGITIQNRALFPFYIASSKHEEGWENSRQLCKPSTMSRVCITFKNSPNLPSVKMKLCKRENQKVS